MTQSTRMKHKETLSNLDKDQLIEVILGLMEKIETLEWKSQSKPPSESSKPKKNKKKRWKKLGAPEGHKGATRSKPDTIDQTIHVTLDGCPECGNTDLVDLVSQRKRHIQEDIVPAKVEATEFIHHYYWCRCCHKRMKSGYAPDEVPRGYLGPNILIQAVLMKYHQGQSYDKIVGFFKSFCGLKVTDSALVQALQRISQWLNVEEAVILEAVRASPYLHIDETGWKIAGDNHWLWNFVNERLALYRIRHSRGRKIPKEILTRDYQGIVISDFLSAYDKSGRLRQRCLVHLRREMKKIIEKDDDSDESLKAHKKLKRILDDADRLNVRRKQLEPVVFFRRLARLENRLLAFACHGYSRKDWERISKRLLKYYKEILTFLKVPGLASHNNLAERLIRPNVIFRKISFQNMSNRGAQAHETLMSILQTLRLQELDPISFFKHSYLQHRKGSLTPLLSIQM